MDERVIWLQGPEITAGLRHVVAPRAWPDPTGAPDRAARAIDAAQPVVRLHVLTPGPPPAAFRVIRRAA